MTPVRCIDSVLQSPRSVKRSRALQRCNSTRDSRVKATNFVVGPAAAPAGPFSQTRNSEPCRCLRKPIGPSPSIPSKQVSKRPNRQMLSLSRIVTDFVSSCRVIVLTGFLPPTFPATPNTSLRGIASTLTNRHPNSGEVGTDDIHRSPCTRIVLIYRSPSPGPKHRRSKWNSRLHSWQDPSAFRRRMIVHSERSITIQYAQLQSIIRLVNKHSLGLSNTSIRACPFKTWVCPHLSDCGFAAWRCRVRR